MKIRWIPLILLCFLLSCASPQQAPDAKTQVKPPDIPSPVSYQADKEQKAVAKQAEDLYSFSLREADVKDILRAIARQTDYNVVIEPDVKGFTTVDLKEVALPKALEYILEPLNYTFKIEDRTVYVSKPKLEMKVFQLNYIALRKKGTSTVSWKSGGQTTSTGGGGGGGGSSTAQDKAFEIISETDSNMWKVLEDKLKDILSPEGKYIVDRQAFAIFVTDYPKNLKRVGQIVDSIEGVAHRQIVIEAKIVDVILSDAFKAGINWQLVNARIGQFARISGQQYLPAQTVAATSQFFRFFVGSPESGDLNITNTYIDLLKTQGETRILSNPKIQTINNQRAVIKDTTQLVYFDSQQSGAGSTAIATYTTQFVNIGIILDVTPQIDDRGNIVLAIHPAHSILERYEPSPANPTGNGVPVISTRETDTVVRVKDGETVIIAGLIYENRVNGDRGLPGLMSMPLLGALFKVKEESNTRRELVVFLTPRIVYDQDKR